MNKDRFSALPRPGEAGYHAGVRPRDAASLVILRHGVGGARLLMGRRSRGHRFMPGALVFPGGRVDAGDHRVPVAAALDAATLAELTGRAPGAPGLSPARATALTVAAIRETCEETGLVIGRPAAGPLAGGPAWAAFGRHGLAPDPSALAYFARAITPPGLRQRFDTRFFLCDEAAVGALLDRPLSAELEDVDWRTLEEARAGGVAGITRRIVDLVEAIAAGHRPRRGAVAVFTARRNARDLRPET